LLLLTSQSLRLLGSALLALAPEGAFNNTLYSLNLEKAAAGAGFQTSSLQIDAGQQSGANQ
jgi:hypothetical protein